MSILPYYLIAYNNLRDRYHYRIYLQVRNRNANFFSDPKSYAHNCGILFCLPDVNGLNSRNGLIAYLLSSNI